MILSRLPVFLMGVCAGLLRLTQQENFSTSGQVEDVNEKRNFLHDILPWGFVLYGEREMVGMKESGKRWRWRVERNIILLLVVSIAGIWLGGEKINYICQFFCVHMQVVVIYGMTVETEDMAWFTRLCRMRVTRFLGQVSMAVYLLHLTVKDYSHMLHRSLTGMEVNISLKSVCDENKTLYSIPDHDCYQLLLYYVPQAWTIPINTVLTIIVATLATIFIEEPLRKLLKAKPLFTQN